MKKSPLPRRTIPWFLITIFLSLAAGIFITGFFFYQDQQERIKIAAQNDLAAFADLKAGQIAQWRQERIIDAELTCNNAAIARQVEIYFKTPEKTSPKQDLFKFMKSFQDHAGYRSILLLDAKRNVRLSVSNHDDSVCSYGHTIFKEVLLYRQITFSDLHCSKSVPYVHIDLIVPIFSPDRSDSTIIGTLLLRIDPQVVLFPLIKTWPTPSRTSETLLLEQVGDSVVYLNELRHRKNTTLTLRMPISNEQLPASMAARGIERNVEGKDYRSVPVLAAIRKIQNTPWFMIAKVDQEEIYAPLRSQTWIAVIGMFLFLLAAGGIIVSWWRHQQAKFYRDKYLAEVERQALMKHFDYIIKYANDCILLINMDGRIKEVNDQACKVYGYTREEFAQLRIHDLRSERTRLSVDKQMNQVAERGGLVFETEHRRKDGTVFPVEVSSRFIKIDETRFYQSIIRDITERKRAEEKLRSLASRNDAILSSVPDIIMEVDNNKVYTWANRAGIEFFGEDVLGKEAAFYFEGEQETYQKVQPIFIGDENVIYVESWQRRKDGEKRLLAWWCRVLKDENGNVSGALSTARDITDRNRAEEVLKESEERYRQLFELSPDTIFIQSEGNIAFINEAGVHLFGATSKEELIGRRVIHLMHPEYREIVAERIKHLKELKSPVPMIEEKYLRLDGSSVDVEVVASPFLFKGKPAAQVVVRDITQRKLVEQTLRESEDRFRRIFEESPLGMATSNLDFKFIEANATFCRMMGYEENELTSLTFKDITHPEHITGDIESIKRLFAGEIPLYHTEKRYVRKDKRVVWGAATITIVRDMNKRFLYFLAMIEDITERKLGEESLLESEEKYRTLFENSLEGIGLSKGNKVIHANKALLEIFGYDDLDKFLAKPLLEHIAPESQNIIQDMLEKVKKGEPTEKRFTYKIIRKNGEKRDLEIATDHVRIGIEVYTQSTFRDITERKRTEEALRENEEKYRRLFDMESDALFLIDDETGQIIEANAAASTLYGYQHQELLQMRNVDLSAEPDETSRAGKNPTETRIPIRYHRKKDGSVFPIEITATRLSWRGRPAHMPAIRDITERIRSEEALRESEERYRELYTNANIGIYRTTPNGDILLANPQLLNMLGFSSIEALKARNLEQSGFEPSYPRTDFKRKMEQEGEVKGLESAWRRRDGSTIFVRENAKAIHDPDNSILYYDGIAEDITEHKHAEESLRKSEELFKMLVESSPVAIAVFSGATKDIEYVSHRFTQLFGYEQQDIPSLDSWWSFAYPIDEYRNQIESIWNNSVEQAQLEANDTEPLESVITCKDGSSKYIESTFSSMGELTLVFFSDLTQHRMAEEALRQTHAFNDLLIQTMPFGMNIVDEEGNILFVSKAMKEMLTVDVVDMCCWKVYKDNEQQCQDCPLKRGISFGKPDVIETMGILGGKTFQISHVGMMYEGRKAMLEVFQDITEQKKLQQELVQSQKMLSIGTLAGGIAHDFNNILGIILGYTSILPSMKSDPQKFSDGVNAIKQAVDRGAGLVKQILTFARKTDVAFGPLDVPDLTRELVSMLQQTFSKTITFNTEIEIQLPLINADHTQIHQILLNLCVNARDAMPNGGVISIKAYMALGINLRERFPTANEHRYICITVSDTGTGMDETTRNRIFDPFFTTKEKGKGTGLGLSVVYGVVQAHHGFVDVESAVGSGTSFQLYFPVPKESISTLETAKAEKQVHGGNETILVVEDEDLLLDMVQILLETHGYTVLTAKDGMEAVNVYNQHAHEIALVMSDMGLPKLSGDGEFKKLKEINPAVKMILASGFFEPDIKAKLEDAGVRGFLPKPYIIEDVLAKIREALD
ncbi:MAG: PAS domain S-box protein [Ignavibacteriales bacterium]|nr:PAS domain S-box protein [Ignavibacteriales bacterium]